MELDDRKHDGTTMCVQASLWAYSTVPHLLGTGWLDAEGPLSRKRTSTHTATQIAQGKFRSANPH